MSQASQPAPRPADRVKSEDYYQTKSTIFGALIEAIDCEISAVIPFDPQLFGTAANNGQMIAEVQANGKINEALVDLARVLIGRVETKKQRNSLLGPLLERLRKRA